jgi:hypothetical protein
MLGVLICPFSGNTNLMDMPLINLSKVTKGLESILACRVPACQISWRQSFARGWTLLDERTVMSQGILGRSP